MNATASETSIGQTVPAGPSLSRTVPAAAYIGASVCVALATLIGEIIIGYFDIATLTLLYLLPVLASALRWGRGPSLFASFLGVLALDFFFVPPLYSFAVANHKDLAALAIFLLVGIVTGSMATKARSEAEKTRQREKRNLALYSLSRQMASEADLDKLAGSFARTAAESTAGKVSIIMPEKDGRGLREVASYPARNAGLDEKEHAVIQWVLGWGRPAGRGTDTLRDASELDFPRKGGRQNCGRPGHRPGRKNGGPSSRAGPSDRGLRKPGRCSHNAHKAVAGGRAGAMAGRVGKASPGTAQLDLPRPADAHRLGHGGRDRASR